MSDFSPRTYVCFLTVSVGLYRQENLQCLKSIILSSQTTDYTFNLFKENLPWINNVMRENSISNYRSLACIIVSNDMHMVNLPDYLIIEVGECLLTHSHG